MGGLVVRLDGFLNTTSITVKACSKITVRGIGRETAAGQHHRLRDALIFPRTLHTQAGS